MFKKLLAVLLLLGLGGYALWQGILPKEAAKQDDLSVYKDANIKEGNGTEELSYGLEVGNQAPDFSLQELNSDNVKLSDHRGKKVILNFWATWCPPCKAEMPEMQKFHQQYGEEVEILAVNLTSTELNADSVNKYLKEGGYTFSVLLDKKEDVSAKKYKIITVPTTYFIDENGTIVQRINGPMTFSQMEAFAQK